MPVSIRATTPLSTARHTYNIQHQAHLNDPFLYELLWKTQSLSVAPIVASLEGHHFDVVMLPVELQEPTAAPGEIERAIRDNYRLAASGPSYDFFVPEGPD